MDKTVAITGATGHLAASVIPLLEKRGYKMKALQYKAQLPFSVSHLEMVKGSIADKALLSELVTGCDIVIHSAAKISIDSNSDPSVYEINVNGTKNVFAAALEAKVKRFIYVSSIHAYDQAPIDEVLDEHRAYCDDHAARYDRSKRDAEQFVLAQKSGPVEVMVVNPTAIVGPNDYKPSFLGQGIMDMYNRKVPSLIKGGFDFVDVRDVAEGVVNAIERGRNGHSYLLGGKWFSLADLHHMIMETKGDKRNLPVLPAWAGYLGLPFISIMAALSKTDPLYTKESLHTLIHGNKNISSQKAEQELGYRCRPLRDTITDTINWFKQAGHLQ